MRKIIYNENNILLDEGIFFARGVFETILYLNAPISLDKHINRLKKGIRELGLLELEEEELKDYIKKMDIQYKALKVTVTPLNIIISIREIPYSEKDYLKGVSLCFSEVRRNSTSRLSYIKSTGYIENILEKNKAIDIGMNDVIFLNEKGFVTETSCANIFIVKHKKIVTSRIEDGLLSGIIREWIIENFDVEERRITLEDLKESEEVFITNSLMGIMPVTVIENYKFEVGVITKIIKTKYEENLGMEDYDDR